MQRKKDSLSEDPKSPSPRTTMGLMLLRSMAGRDSLDSDQRQLRSQRSPSKFVQAASRFYRQMNQLRNLSSPNGFTAEVEEMRKAFLKRPGCPQFSTRATSVSRMGSATKVDVLKDTGVTSGVGIVTEDLSLDRQASVSSMHGRLFPLSKSACELSYPQKKEQPASSSPSGSPVLVQKCPRSRMPWYISVIHEKDHSLMMLRAELQRLLGVEAQVQKKDQAILMLQKERDALKRQLKTLLRSKGQETVIPPVRMERSFETSSKMGQLSIMKIPYKDEDELQRWMQMQEGSSFTEPCKELQLEPRSIHGAKSADRVPADTQKARPRGTVGRRGAVQQEGSEEYQGEAERSEEEEDQEEEDEEEEEQEVVEEEQEVLEEEERPRRLLSLTDSFEEELMAQLEEYEHMLMEFQNELELTRCRHTLATGAITSLQRRVDFQESQLRKVNTENEMLVKELRERKQQLQAMTDKFSSLQEEKKHQEIMGIVERDNLFLRQQVSNLEGELAQRDHVIMELQSKVSELQAKVDLDENHLQRWKQLHDDVQSRNEAIHQAELQSRVALEGSQARLERLRNKIIQATFSIGGFKNTSTEVTDSCILEALQRIITERTDFYNQLKQKGMKVLPLQQSDISLPTKIKKMASK